jgi:hypothetical protein
VVEALESLLDRDDLDLATRCRLLDAFVSEMAGEDDPRVAAFGAEAITIARQLGDGHLLAFALATGIKSTHVEGRTELRSALAAELEPLARRLGLPAFRWYAAYGMATVASARGDVAALRGWLATGLELTSRYRMIEAEAVQSFGGAMLAHVQGRFADAERIYLEVADRMGRAGSMHAEGFLGIALCTLRLTQGRIGELEPLLRDLAGAYPEGRDAWAIALHQLGRTAEAKAARAELAPLRHDYFFSIFATIRAMAVVTLRASDEAPELIRSLLPLRDQMPGSLSATLALQPVALTLGELCRLAGREDEARAHFAHAATIAERWGSPHWVARARRLSR